MNATYPPAATTPVRIRDTVTGLTLAAIGNIRAPIVANALDDDRCGSESCECREAERPSAGDVGPPVDAQVDAGEADERAKRQGGPDQRRAAREAAEHPGRDDGRRDIY